MENVKKVCIHSAARRYGVEASSPFPTVSADETRVACVCVCGSAVKTSCAHDM